MTTEEFKTQYLSLHKRLYALAFKQLGNSNDAEDAVQTLYLRLWERRQQLHLLKDRWSYCARALTNICHDHREERTKQAHEDINENIPDAGNKEYEVTDFLNFADHYIEQLPDRQQTVMQMRMQGATTEEIMNSTGISATNIRTILSRVRQELRKFYK